MKPVTFKSALLYIYSYWRHFPLAVSGVFLTIGVMILCDVLLPVFAGQIIDAVALGLGPEGVTPSVIQSARFAFLVFLGLQAGYFGVGFLKERIWIWLASETMQRIVQDAFHRVQRFSTDWHANSFGGATVRKITRGKWAYDEMADSLFYGLIPSTLIVIGMSVMLANFWPVVGAILFAGIAGLYLGNWYLMTRYVAPSNRVFNARDTKLGAVLADSITCNAVVKSFGSETREDESLGTMATSWRDGARSAWYKQTNAMGLQSSYMLVLISLMVGTVLYYWSVGRATPGQVTMVLTSYFIINGYMRHIGFHMRNIQKAINEMEDVIHFMEQPLGVVDQANAMTFAPGEGLIELDGVTFCYENQATPLYENFSLTIQPGEKVALVGYSGSGKSSFVKLAQRLYDINSGEIRIDGQNIAAVQQSSLREAIALVPQEPILFHRSLRDNIAYGKPGATLAEVVEASKKAHAHEFIHQLKEGYETLVGERGVKLSGGERQRVALARAFLADCPILILDEATSSLDSHTEAFIQASMQELMDGRTTVVIAHRLSTIRQVDRILVFDKGTIIEQGTHDELMSRDTHYRSLVAVQLMEETTPMLEEDLAS